MTATAREWRLRRRPQGWPTAEDVELAERELPDPREGQVLVRNLWLSVDPYMRGRMNEAKSYAQPYELGKAMYGGAVGQVVASAVPSLPEGALVRHALGWRTHSLVPAAAAERLDGGPGDGSGRTGPDVPLSAYLGVLGMPGLTAWVGTYDIGEIRPGETFFVSAASGAVGAVAGQLARLAGCRVVGSAGSAEKVRWLTEELGFDAAFDYHDGDVTGQLRAAAPEGVDVYFENVGGDHLRAALACLRPFGRIAACGMISAYNEAQPGPDNLFQIVGKKLKVQGFIVSDHAHREPVFRRHVGGLLERGELRHRETVREGIESTFDALLDVLRGGQHVGKLVVHLGDPEP